MKQDLGTVSVGCPKVWRSDRVFSVLDGIMRDVDSMTIRALEGLDANAANQAAIDLIQNSFDLTAKYDQAAAINNQFALQKLKTARTNEVAAYNADADFRQKLTQQRNALTLQLFDAQAKERQQIQSGASTTDIQATQAVETSLQAQIASINSSLNTTPPSISDASLASTASTTISPSDQPQHATLDKMPPVFQDALTNLLKQPTFPPAIAMDNVIDLLHQRIAREFAVIYDDLMRDSEHFDVYLVQFDTSINPKPDARDRGVHVEMTFDHCDDQTVSVPLAYELYPSAAAYNIMHGFNQTTHTGITGIAQTVVGFGLQASFQHDHSSLRSGLSQSIYASGFGAGQCRFGWDFAPAPNENRLAPGLRTTYAILRVPKVQDMSGLRLQAKLSVDWTVRDRRYPGWNPLNWHRSDESKRIQDPKIAVILPMDHVLRLTHVSYVPADTGEKGTGDEANNAKPAAPASAPAAAGASVPAPANATVSAAVSAVATPTPTPRPAVIQVRFDYPVDPNLIVTVNDQILKRVRDVRGRGLYSDSTTPLHLAGNAAETGDLSGSRFGLLESDTLGDDTWFQADSRTILLNVGRKTAGTDHFPVIRIIDPSAGVGGELTALAREADEVRVGEWFFTQTNTLTSSTFQPLFTRPYGVGRFEVLIQNVETGRNTSGNNYLKSVDLRIISHAHLGRRPIYLNDQAQVVVEADASEEHYILPHSGDKRLPPKQRAVPLQANWALDCRQDRGALVCPVPLSAFRQFCAAGNSKENAAELATQLQPDAPFACLSDFKVWVDQAPYYGRSGLWGDQNFKDGVVLGPNLRKEMIPRGSYRINEAKVDDRSPIGEYMWSADLDLINFNPASDYCIPELADTALGPSNKVDAAAKIKGKTGSWSAEQIQFWTKELEEVRSKPNPCAGTQNSAFVLEKTEHGIHLKVPFAYFLELPESLHLKEIPQRQGAQQQGTTASLPEPIELPSLRDQLIPGDVKIIDLGGKKYQFQGEHMRAVHSVYVTNKKDQKSKFIPIESSSYNMLEVDASGLDDGTNYTIQLGIGEGKFGDAYVDLFQTDKSGLETQQVLLIPAKATTTKTDTTNTASGAVSQTTTITASAGATPTATVTQTTNGAPKTATASTTKSNSTSVQTQDKKNGPTQTGTIVKTPTPTPTKTPQASKTPAPGATPTPTPAATKTDPTKKKQKKK